MLTLSVKVSKIHLPSSDCDDSALSFEVVYLIWKTLKRFMFGGGHFCFRWAKLDLLRISLGKPPNIFRVAMNGFKVFSKISSKT